MTGRRSKLEIYVDILAEIKSGNILPTKIMYATNMSWKPLQQMLKSLINQELIVELESNGRDQRSNIFYSITEKGNHVIEYFGKIECVIEKKKPIEMMNWR